MGKKSKSRLFSLLAFLTLFFSFIGIKNCSENAPKEKYRIVKTPHYNYQTKSVFFNFNVQKNINGTWRTLNIENFTDSMDAVKYLDYVIDKENNIKVIKEVEVYE